MVSLSSRILSALYGCLQFVLNSKEFHFLFKFRVRALQNDDDGGGDDNGVDEEGDDDDDNSCFVGG